MQHEGKPCPTGSPHIIWASHRPCFAIGFAALSGMSKWVPYRSR